MSIRDDNRVRRSVERGTLQADGGFSAVAIAPLQGERDQVRDSDREGLFVDRPIPLWTGVLVTDDANRRAAAMNRYVHHRHDVQRPQVDVREFTGPRIAYRIIDRNDLAFGDGAEIIGKVAGPQGVA